MARKVNIIIPSSLSDEFEQFVTRTEGTKYERYTCGSPLSTRYKMTRKDLHCTCISICYAPDVESSMNHRAFMLYCIARDLLNPITDVNP